MESLVFDLFANLGASGLVNTVSEKFHDLLFIFVFLVLLLYLCVCVREIEFLLKSFFPLNSITEEQLDFPVLYASAKEGWASSTFTKDPPSDARNMSQLLDAILKYVPPPTASLDAPFQMLVG